MTKTLAKKKVTISIIVQKLNSFLALSNLVLGQLLLQSLLVINLAFDLICYHQYLFIVFLLPKRKKREEMTIK